MFLSGGGGVRRHAKPPHHADDNIHCGINFQCLLRCGDHKLQVLLQHTELLGVPHESSLL